MRGMCWRSRIARWKQELAPRIANHAWIDHSESFKAIGIKSPKALASKILQILKEVEPRSSGLANRSKYYQSGRIVVAQDPAGGGTAVVRPSAENANSYILRSIARRAF
jgi:hypothetical protein